MNEAIQKLEEYDTTTRCKGRLVSSQRITPLHSEEEVRELVLEIEVAGRAPYQVRHREVVGLESAHQLAPGAELPVVVDRSDPLILRVEIS